MPQEIKERTGAPDLAPESPVLMSVATEENSDSLPFFFIDETRRAGLCICTPGPSYFRLAIRIFGRSRGYNAWAPVYGGQESLYGGNAKHFSGVAVAIQPAGYGVKIARMLDALMWVKQY